MKCCGNVQFQVAHLNWGSGFNMKNGIFTTPISGLYIITFSAISGSPKKNRIRLRKNNYTVGNAWGESTHQTMTISSTLFLEKGDKMFIELMQGSLFDNGHRISHFTGTLLDQQPIVINGKDWKYAKKGWVDAKYNASKIKTWG